METQNTRNRITHRKHVQDALEWIKTLARSKTQMKLTTEPDFQKAWDTIDEKLPVTIKFNYRKRELYGNHYKELLTRDIRVLKELGSVYNMQTMKNELVLLLLGRDIMDFYGSFTLNVFSEVSDEWKWFEEWLFDMIIENGITGASLTIEIQWYTKGDDGDG